MKQCSSCKETKDIEMFRNNRTTKDGKGYQCKACEKEQKKKYYIENKEKISEKNKAYDKTASGKISLAKREERRKLSGKKQEKARKYYLENSEKIKKQASLYKLTEYGRTKLYLILRARRALKKSTSDNTITYENLEQLKIDQNFQCKYCNKDLNFVIKRAVHLDHIVPLSKGGTHSITNVAWSCSTCNLKKSAKII